MPNMDYHNRCEKNGCDEIERMRTFAKCNRFSVCIVVICFCCNELVASVAANVLCTMLWFHFAHEMCYDDEFSGSYFSPVSFVFFRSRECFCLYITYKRCPFYTLLFFHVLIFKRGLNVQFLFRLVYWPLSFSFVYDLRCAVEPNDKWPVWFCSWFFSAFISIWQDWLFFFLLRLCFDIARYFCDRS